MNILVTGAGGQLGKKIQQQVSRINTENKYFFLGRKELDITNLQAVSDFIADNKINVIVNCAAYTNVDKAQMERNEAHVANTMGPIMLATAALGAGATLIHISTDYVFSPSKVRNTPLSPVKVPSVWEGKNNNIYGYTKMLGEMGIIDSKCNYIILRTSWLYSTEGKNFVKTMFTRSRNNQASSVVFDQVGSPTNAADLAKFIVRIIEEDNERGYLKKTGIYNYANNGVASWYDITKAVYRLANGNAELVKPVTSDAFPTKATRPHYSVFDLSKTESTFDENTRYWQDSLEEVVNDLKKCEERERLEAQNEEYDYGHDIKNNEEK